MVANVTNKVLMLFTLGLIFPESDGQLLALFFPLENSYVSQEEEEEEINLAEIDAEFDNSFGDTPKD